MMGFPRACSVSCTLEGSVSNEQDLEKAVHWWTKARWNGDRLAASYLQVHRDKEAAEKAWEEEQKNNSKKN